MIDPWHFDRVQIVQDLRTEPNSKDLPADKQGTKVIAEVLEAAPESLFPLQGALGYEIYQTLFIGPNTPCGRGKVGPSISQNYVGTLTAER